MTDRTSKELDRALAELAKDDKAIQRLATTVLGVDTEQPAPRRNEQPAVWPLVVEDMQRRDALGRARYGTPLQPFNGRDMLRDAYDEVLDLAVYIRGAIFERDGK